MLWSCAGDWWFITFKTVEPMCRINFEWIIHCFYSLESCMIDKHNLKEKSQTQKLAVRDFKVVHFTTPPPFPHKMFYKPNVASVCAAEDVYSSLHSGSLSNYWLYSVKLSGDWVELQCMDHPSVCGPSFPAAVPGLIPADSPQFGTPGTGSLLTGKCPQQGSLSQGDFQLPVLHLLLSFNFWGENLLRQRTSTRKLRGESSQQKMEKGRSVLEARKMINVLWLSPWSTSTPRHRVLGFLLVQTSLGSASCTVGIWKNLCCSPSGFLTLSCVRIYIYVLACPGCLILAMLGL